MTPPVTDIIVRELLELHCAELKDAYDRQQRKKVEVKVCGYCASLCHSETGLGCEDLSDAIWPCDTVKIIQEQTGMVL